MVGMGIGVVVFGDSVFKVSGPALTGVDDPEVTWTQVLAGDLMVVSITQAKLFLGTGASLNSDSTSVAFGTVTLPATNDATAVGFRIAGASMNLGIFTARQRATSASATYQTVPVTKYTGLQSELGQAQLMGVSAFTLIARNLVFQLNATSVTNGRVLDWNDTQVASANISLGPTDPTFRIGGSVGFRVADVVFGNATLNMTRRTVSGVADPDSATKRLSGELLGPHIPAPTLFIGTGSPLGGGGHVNTTAACGRTCPTPAPLLLRILLPRQTGTCRSVCEGSCCFMGRTAAKNTGGTPDGLSVLFGSCCSSIVDRNTIAAYARERLTSRAGQDGYFC